MHDYLCEDVTEPTCPHGQPLHQDCYRCDEMDTKDKRKLVHDRVMTALGDTVICNRCGATFKTMNDQCSAEMLDACPGFLAIDKVQVPIEEEVFKL